jgi:glycosyltransferase involved in cell wall biosynthesis
VDLKYNQKVLLIENSAEDFIGARLSYAKYLQDVGYEVYALVPNHFLVKEIELEGIHVFSYNFDRKNKGIFQIFRLILFYRKIINKYKIEIIHSFRFQPNIISTLTNFFNSRKVIIHITGLGIVFANYELKYKVLKIISQSLYQLILIRANKIIVQNEEDKKELWFNFFWEKKLDVVLGSGVDLDKYDKLKFKSAELRIKNNLKLTDKIFIIVSRLLWEKGIKELTTAFDSLNKVNKNLKLLIVGWSDDDNPRNVSKDFIDLYKSSDYIQFLGRIDDIVELLALSDCFIFPSYYREGVPRGVLEALSMSLPVITTNMPGCNITVDHSLNGYLIEARSSNEIINSVHKICAEDNFINMGLKSRALAKNKFSNKIIYQKISKHYLE